MITANEFWDWFSANNSKYYFLDDTDDNIQEELLDSLLDKLQSYSMGLYFLVGGDPNEDKEFIITAEGNSDYFEDVINLVNAAPQLERWNIIAFKPAQAFDFKTNYNNVELDPHKLWFLPLKNSNTPKKIGIRIGVSQVVSETEKQDYLFAAHIILDTILGEKSAAEDIGYVDIEQLPANFEALGYIELSRLIAYINWSQQH